VKQMSNGYYNLLHEKWLLATDLQGVKRSFSLLEIFEKAHQMRRLAGELPTQDVAILRLLLAVLHTVFFRFSPDGEPDELDCQEEAIQRWREVWEAGKFPYRLIENYLLSYEDRFFLFHDKYPFMQVKSGTGYWTSEGKKIAASVKDMNYFNGEIAESENKKNVFISRERVSELACDESARWLIHLNSFDLSPAGRPPQNEVKITGYKSAWLSNLGLVYVEGDTLFSTLMLNLVLGPEDVDDFIDGKPIWEEDKDIGGTILENINVPVPKTLNTLYTMRFRYVELVPSEDMMAVTKALIWSGCKFDEGQNLTIEPMTVWFKTENGLKPKPHSADQRIWQDIPSIIAKYQDETERPGVLNWINDLMNAGVSIGRIKLKTTGCETKQNSAIKDVFSDGFAIHSLLIAKAEEGGWLLRIRDEVKAIEKMAEEIGNLSKELRIAKGERSEGQKLEAKKVLKSKEQAYSLLDIPFRQWLESIDPESDDVDKRCGEWRETAKRILLELAEELIEQAGPQALVGRQRDKEWFTSAKAHLRFINRVKKI